MEITPHTLTTQQHTKIPPDVYPVPPQIDESDLQNALNKVLLDNLKPLSAGLAMLYMFLTIGYSLSLDHQNSYWVVVFAAASVVILFGIWISLKKWRISSNFAHAIGSFIAGVVLFNVLSRLYLLADPLQTISVLLIIIGVGALMFSWQWLMFNIVSVVTIWAIIIVNSVTQVDWVDFGFPMASTIALSLILHVARVKTYRRLEKLHMQDEHLKNEFLSLYQEEKARRHLAETLYRVGRGVTGTLNLTEVLNLILANLFEIVPYSRGSVLLRHDDELEFVAARGFPSDFEPRQIRVSIREQDVFEQVYQSQEPLAISNVSNLAEWHQLEGLPLAHSWLGVPLKYRSNVIGMVSLVREDLNPYINDEITLATTFADQAAIALENARLYDELHQFNQFLEEEVAKRTEDLRMAYAQLERLDQAKSDFISIAAHELRTPLTALRGYSQMLLRMPAIVNDATCTDLLNTVNNSAVRMSEVVTSMTDMATIDNKSLQLYPETVALKPMIENICTKLTPAIEERKLLLNIEIDNNLPDIEADSEALLKVFQHLITNAIKYTPDERHITIRGHLFDDTQDQFSEQCVEIVICDTGIGIDPELQELIFTKFYQIGQLNLHSTSTIKFKGGGPGLGLAITKGIVETHGGKIWVESPKCDEEALPGSRFHVVLPVVCQIKEENLITPSFE